MPAFEALLSLKDMFSPAVKQAEGTLRGFGGETEAIQFRLQQLEAALGKAGLAAKQAGHEISRVEHGHEFGSIGEQVNLLHEHFGELRESIGATGERLTELLPMLGGLGAVGSVAGLFELVEHTSDSASELTKMSKTLGFGTEALQKFNIVAKLTDVGTEAMDTSLEKFNKTVGDVARGHNKDAAGLFKHLHISIHDAHGSLKSIEELLPDVADAFEHTTSAQTRASMATALFGKAGQDLIPMLMEGKKGIADLVAQAGELAYIYSDEDKENLEAYHKSWVGLTAAVGGTLDAIGAQLAPVLKPIIDMFKQWLVVHREWIAANVKQVIIDIADALKRVDWVGWGQDLQTTFGYVRSAVEDLGGLKTVVEGLIALRLVGWLAGIGGNFVTLARGIGDTTAALDAFLKKSAETAAVSGAEGAAAGGAGAAAAGGAAAAEAGGVGAGEAGAEGAGVGVLLKRALTAEGLAELTSGLARLAIRAGLPATAFVMTLDGGALNRGERRTAAPPSYAPPAYEGEPEGPAPTVRLKYDDQLPQFPRIVVPLRLPQLPSTQYGGDVPAAQLPPIVPAAGGRSTLYGGDVPAPLPSLYGGSAPSAPAAPPVHGNVDVTVTLTGNTQAATVAARGSGDVTVRTRSDTGPNHPTGEVSLGDDWAPRF